MFYCLSKDLEVSRGYSLANQVQTELELVPGTVILSRAGAHLQWRFVGEAPHWLGVGSHALEGPLTLTLCLYAVPSLPQEVWAFERCFSTSLGPQAPGELWGCRDIDCLPVVRVFALCLVPPRTSKNLSSLPFYCKMYLFYWIGGERRWVFEEGNCNWPCNPPSVGEWERKKCQKEVGE